MRLFHRSSLLTSGTANRAELSRKSSRLRRGGGCTPAIFHTLEELGIPECNAMEQKWAGIVYWRRNHVGFLACGDVCHNIPQSPGRKFSWLWRRFLQNWVIECFVAFSIFWNGMEFRMYEATWGGEKRTKSWKLSNKLVKYRHILIHKLMSSF